MNRTLGTGSIDRSARVRRIKRVIIGLVIAAVLLPSMLSVGLFVKVVRLEKQVTELSYERERVNVITESTTVNEPNKAEPQEISISPDKLNKENADTLTVVQAVSDDTQTDDELRATDDSQDIIVLDDTQEIPEESGSDETADGSDNMERQEILTIDESEVSAGVNEDIKLKRVYLTFDDGPSSNTARILDILNEYNVKGTFFVVGRLSDTTTPMYKRIVDEGHAIGMHSYTHKYGEIYKDVDSFIYDIDRIQSLIYEQTGVLTRLYRFPGGSSNTVSKTDISILEDELYKRDIKYFDWNVVSGDADSHHKATKEEIVRNCTMRAMTQETAVILMHDLPEKAATVEALPDIIEYFQSIGVEILPLDENAAEVHHTVNMTE